MPPPAARDGAAGPVRDEEFGFSPREFERIRRLIHQRAGISLGSSKQHMVFSRLVRRLRHTGLPSFRGYVDRLEHDPADPEWQGFVNALTTNLTAFFREPHHFERLAELLRRFRSRPRIDIWCNAASTGEEPYSLAMTAVEVFDSWTPPVRILATDIDTEVLRRAEAGVYPLDRLDGLDTARRRRFLQRGTGPREGLARVREPLRQLVSFRPLNLLDPHWPVRGPFEAVFCRNLMIYFDKPTQYRLLARLAPMIAAEGLLFAGHSESFGHAAEHVRSLGGTVYAPVSGAAAGDRAA